MDSESTKTQTLALPLPPLPPLPPRKYAPPLERKEILKKHSEWLESNGESGERADFSGGHLDGADLTDANLEDAWLNKTTLKCADLLLANFKRASLLQANLEGANLLGTRLQEADLQGATLDKATGLQEEQLAGANLFGATLPADVSVFEALTEVAKTAKEAGWLVLAMVAISLAAAFRVITTSDAQILGHAPILPFRVFSAFPLNAVYLLGPVLLLGLYVWLHLYLQRLWESLSTLPAIFPDGQPLDRLLPWFAAQVARAYLKWLQNRNRVLVALEAAISGTILYWMVPATLLLFWGRYLTFQDFRGTALHILLVVAASLAAGHFSKAMKRALGASAAPEGLFRPGIGRRWDFARVFAVALGVAILLLSIGVISGSPHTDGDVSGGHNNTAQSWAANALWLIGYSPVAQVSGADISEKPKSWTGRDEELALVRGARLSKTRLHYIQANGAFFAKANLWQADLQNGDLSEADLRETKARQANLRYATLDRAKLNRSDLQEADLRQANLTRADLEKADLTSASLNAASLVDSNLDGASLYGADLRGASMQRASLQQADLREANLAGADMSAANLGNAYLSAAKMAGAKLENAELDSAFLTQADLHGADLRSAKLAGAALNGANLQGADLRGALGLSAMQVCSAANIGQIQLDETLRQAVATECGNK